MSRDLRALQDRVRKLLSLATSPNVHEAAAAAAKAQALIEQHRLQGLLDADDADTQAITDGRDAPLESARRPRKWKTVLASGLAQVNGCTAYTADEGRETHILLAGRDEDREAVRAIWPWLVQRIAWCSATHGEGQDRAWHDAFRVGAAEVIVQRLAEARTETRQALGTTALARVQPALAERHAAVERFVTETLRLRRGRRLRVDAAGYATGRAEGGRLPLPEA